MTKPCLSPVPPSLTPHLPKVSSLTTRWYSDRCSLHPAPGLPGPCSLPAHLLHNADDAGDEGVRVLMLLGAGVQVHASLLKHHLRKGTSEGGAQKGANGSGPGAGLFSGGRGLGVANPKYQQTSEASGRQWGGREGVGVQGCEGGRRSGFQKGRGLDARLSSQGQGQR